MRKRPDRFMVGFARSGHPAYGRDEERPDFGGTSQYADPMTELAAHRYLKKNLYPSRNGILAFVFELVPIAAYRLKIGETPELVLDMKKPSRASRRNKQ